MLIQHCFSFGIRWGKMDTTCITVRTGKAVIFLKISLKSAPKFSSSDKRWLSHNRLGRSKNKAVGLTDQKRQSKENRSKQRVLFHHFLAKHLEVAAFYCTDSCQSGVNPLI